MDKQYKVENIHAREGPLGRYDRNVPRDIWRGSGNRSCGTRLNRPCDHLLTDLCVILDFDLRRRSVLLWTWLVALREWTDTDGLDSLLVSWYTFTCPNEYSCCNNEEMDVRVCAGNH